MTDLPKELLDSLEQKEKAQMKHNWMYSFMPKENRIYLVGYCKTCNNSVASIVPTNANGIPGARISYSGIPKWGCIPEHEPDI